MASNRQHYLDVDTLRWWYLGCGYLDSTGIALTRDDKIVQHLKQENGSISGVGAPVCLY
jgi:hypothetical protein